MTMTNAMKTLTTAWENREGPAVMTTVAANGTPNSIYVGEIRLEPEIGFIVADNYFDKTRKNIEDGSGGAILFIAKDGKAYQAKGAIEYHKSGVVYDKMLEIHDPKHPGVAAAVVKIDELYSGAEKIDIGR